MLGIEPRLVASSDRRGRNRDLVSPCFVTPSKLELLWEGRKLVGSAQRRLKRAFLQHGSIPLRNDYAVMSRVFRTPPEDLRSAICSLEEALGYRPAFTQIREALVRGFEEILKRSGDTTVRSSVADLVGEFSFRK